SDDIDLVAAMELSPFSWWAKLLQRSRQDLHKPEKAANGDLHEPRRGKGQEIGAQAIPTSPAVGLPLTQAVEGPVVPMKGIPVSLPVAASQLVNCPSCGAPCHVGANFCSNCGKRLGLVAVAGAPRTVSPSHQPPRWARSVSPPTRAGWAPCSKASLPVSPAPVALQAPIVVSAPMPLRAPVLGFEPVTQGFVQRPPVPMRTTLPAPAPKQWEPPAQVGRHTFNGAHAGHVFALPGPGAPRATQ
ncbi:unnamed protein product, partial [Symbiodinium pilosum]